MIADEATIQWNSDADYWLDVSEFELLSLRPEHRDSAIAIYRGDLLERFSAEWLCAPRERLRDMYVGALDAAMQRARDKSDFAGAIKTAHLLLSADPWREDVLRQIMELRYAVGDRAGALFEFEQFAKRLQLEMSISVMPETSALRVLIARNERMPERPRLPGIGASADSASLPLVGREREMEHLRLCLSRAIRGRGTTVFIAGESGIGKSRLSAEIAQVACEQGARIMLGGTTLPEASPYQSLSEALRPAVPELAAGIEALRLAALVPLLPDLATAASGLARLLQLDPERERIRLFEALVGTFETLAADQPLVLILEDLHWAGAATAAALESLARLAAARSMLIIATYRDEELPAGHVLRAVRRRLLREHKATHLSPRRLSSNDVDRLVSLIPAVARRAQFGKRVFDLSEGNPLFVAQVIRDLVETRMIKTAATTQPRALVVSDVSAAIVGRLERLSPDALLAAKIAAVAGSAFDMDVLADMTGWTVAQALAAIGELMDRNLIREGTNNNGFDYVFTHHKIQEAAYSRLDEDERARRHHRVAHVLERHAEHPDEIAAHLAYHYERAGDAPRAARWYLAAARNALAMYANEEAGHHSSRALTLASTLVERVDALKLHEEACARRGDRGAQRNDIAELQRLAQETDDVELQCETFFRDAMLRHATGERDPEARAIASLSELAQRCDVEAWRLRAEIVKATCEIDVAEYEHATVRLTALYESRARLHDVPGQVDCLCLLAEIAHHRENVVELSDIIARVQALDLSQVKRPIFARLHELGARVALMAGDHLRCSQLAEQWVDESAAIGDRQGEAAAHRFLVGAKTYEGDFSGSREHFRLASALYSRIEDADGYAALVYNDALYWGRTAHFEQAEALFAQAAELFEALGSLRGMTQCYIGLGSTRFWLDKVREGNAATRHAIELSQALHSPYLESIAQGNCAADLLSLGDLSGATQHAQRAVALSREQGRSAALGRHLVVLALCTLARGNREAAKSLADESRALYESCDDLARGDFTQEPLWGLARIYRELDMAADARVLLGTAYDRLQGGLADLPDDDSRESYRSMRFNREIRAAFERSVWPPTHVAAAPDSCEQSAAADPERPRQTA